MAFHFLKKSPQWIPGIGPILAKRLADAGYKTFFDLLACLPTCYRVYGNILPAKGGPVYLEIIVGKMVGKNPWKIQCTTQCHHLVELIFFQRPKNIWIFGQTIWIKGMMRCNIYGQSQIIHPERVVPWPMTTQKIRIIPEYTLPKGITSWRFSSWIQHILTHWPNRLWSPVVFYKSNIFALSTSTDNRMGSDPISEKNINFFIPICDKKQSDHDLIMDKETENSKVEKNLSWYNCFLQAHFPQEKEMMLETASWRKNLAYSEWTAKQLALIQSEEKEKNLEYSPKCTAYNTHTHRQFLENFGHSLTYSQEQAWRSISQELSLDKPMMRLLNGDVGSGKTLVAFLALIQMALSGYQSCLMAPTEILIRQHFMALTQCLKNISVQLILGKGERMGPRDAPIVLGTHALLYDSVSFNNLGLVIIDEQQRFGVHQRLSLIKKGSNPHVLFLSATPIPRTFQRLMCGDMNISIIEKRTNQIPLSNYIVSIDKIDDLKPWIQGCLYRKECIYWVCPAIQDDHFGVYNRYAYWESIFPSQVGYLHGQMSPEEKDLAMEEFRSGEKPILITTTVIEVGIHVSQASTIFIEESPSFGLSQLHQLRGRVGRDTIPGHCFFLYTPPLTPYAQERLLLMRHCQDGFKIAEKDWLWRGAGTLLGTEQSGHAHLRFIHKENHAYLARDAVHNAIYMHRHHLIQSQQLLEIFGYHNAQILKAG